uniref:Active regulator of SIRT1 n=1 Tax=Oryctolagus cuniculus TaxID=9986 RepID=G1TG84_RABIT
RRSPSARSLPKCPPAWASHAETRSPELRPSLPHGRQRPLAQSRQHLQDAGSGVQQRPAAPRHAPGPQPPCETLLPGSSLPAQGRGLCGRSTEGFQGVGLKCCPAPTTAEYRKRECRDHLKANLKFMTSARSPVAESMSRQILRQNRGRKACDRPVAKTKKKKEAEGTVFTEEDFQRFQQEYFGS